MEEQVITISPQDLHSPHYDWSLRPSSTYTSLSPPPLDRTYSSSSDSWESIDSPASAVQSVSPLETPLITSIDEHLYLNELFHSAAQEVERLNKAILDRQTELVLLFQQKQREIDLLKARRTNHITRWKSFFALVYKLPDDVLLLVFEAFVLELGQSPWIIAHVSRRFREVAFRARKIWARLLLKPSFTIGARNQSGWEVCRDLSQLSRALSRAGGTNLSISIHSCDLDRARLLHSNPNRWASVTYVDQGNQEVDAELFGNRERLASVTKLQVVGGGSLKESKLIEWVQRFPPPHLALTDHSLHMYDRNGNWGRLCTLYIKLPQLGSCTHPWTSHSTAVIAEILRASSSTLTSLSLENIPFQEISLPTPIEFPQVTDLSLRSVTQWQAIIAPNATKYSITFGRGEAYEHTAHFRFTNQVALVVTSALGTQSRGVLTLPSEDQITINGSRGWSIDRQATEAEIAPQPYILHLHDIQISSDDLIRRLRSLPHLIELHIHSSAIAPIFFKAFAVDPTSRKLGKAPLLPRLQVLNVHLVTNSRAQGSKVKESYDSTFTKISEVRKRKLGVLKMLKVEYPREMGGVLQWY